MLGFFLLITPIYFLSARDAQRQRGRGRVRNGEKVTHLSYIDGVRKDDAISICDGEVDLVGSEALGAVEVVLYSNESQLSTQHVRVRISKTKGKIFRKLCQSIACPRGKKKKKTHRTVKLSNWDS